MIFLGIIISIIMFSIIVLLHEYWHYSVAKFFKIHIEEFGLWIPPRAKKLWKNKWWTLFSLNWIPLGGFVKIAGESEIFLEYYSKKWKLLTLEKLKKKNLDEDSFYDKSWKKISKSEQKFISAQLKNRKDGRNFYEKSIFAKSAVLVAGVIMNFILAFVIFSILFFVWIKPLGINSVIETNTSSKIIPTLSWAIQEWVIEKQPGIILLPVKWSIAEISWIQKNDVLLRVDDQNVNWIKDLQAYISNKKNQNTSFYIERKKACTEQDYEKKNCPIIEYLSLDLRPDNEWKIGTYLAENLIVNNDFLYKYGLADSIKYGLYETYAQISLTFSALNMLAKNIFIPDTPEDRKQALESVAWPIWIVWLITQSLQWWVLLLLVLWAIISVNLWVFNILPLPALDGWRLLILWIRSGIDYIFGKTSLSWKVENFTHVIFFLVLIALSILIAYNDIVKIIFKDIYE